VEQECEGVGGNIMLVEWEGEVARRLGVGKIYLDHWEEAGPKMRWVVLE
jgi:hypothetical protein